MKTFAILSLAAAVMAKTDLAGCTSSVVGASLLWYVPSNGEICSILDSIYEAQADLITTTTNATTNTAVSSEQVQRVIKVFKKQTHSNFEAFMAFNSLAAKS